MAYIPWRVLSYARQHYRQDIEDLLDDPSDLLHPDNTEPPADAIRELRLLGTMLGLDFDALVEELGQGFDADRLRKIESGEIKRASKKGA